MTSSASKNLLKDPRLKRVFAAGILSFSKTELQPHCQRPNSAAPPCTAQSNDYTSATLSISFNHLLSLSYRKKFEKLFWGIEYILAYSLLH
jgi:hypothetical protein